MYTKSMVLAYCLDASSHHVSHHSHSCGSVLTATWWIMLLGRSCNCETYIMVTFKIIYYLPRGFMSYQKIYELIRSLYILDQDLPSCSDLGSALDTALAICLRRRCGGIAWDLPRTTRWCDKLVPASGFANILASKTWIRPFRLCCRRMACTRTARRQDPTSLTLSNPLVQPARRGTLV